MGRRNPKKEPATLKGTEMMNQIRTMANMVPMGTAPEECAAMRKKLRNIKVPKTILEVSICYGR
jgi:hypothetical protein